jgi:hypothetical protein
MRKRAAFGLTTILVTLAAMLSGCSGNDGGAANLASKLTAAEIVKAAPEKAAEEDTVHLAATIEVTGMPGYGSVATEMTGEIDFANNRSSMKMEILGLEMETIQSGSVIYMKMDGLIDGWIKMDYAELLGDSAAQQLMGGTNSNDPAAMLEQLRGTADSVEEVGSSEIRGVQTTHYRAMVDANKALEELRALAGDDGVADEMIELAASMYKTPYAVDVWIDADNLVRRMSFTLETTGEGSTPGMAGLKTTMTMDYFDYGKPVDIAIPDDSDVTDWSDYMEELLAGG